MELNNINDGIMDNEKNKAAGRKPLKCKKKENQHAEDIPSHQDRPWVDESQMPQKQFDKTEYEEEQLKKKNKH